jgi:hypothetical protein
VEPSHHWRTHHLREIEVLVFETNRAALQFQGLTPCSDERLHPAPGIVQPLPGGRSGMGVEGSQPLASDRER